MANFVAQEGGMLAIDIAIKDARGVLVTPNFVNWTLRYWTMEGDGSIVNNRDQVSLPVASESTIILKGDDLPAGTLLLKVYAEYDEPDMSDIPNPEFKTIFVNRANQAFSGTAT